MTDPQSPGSDAMLSEVCTPDPADRERRKEAPGFPPDTDDEELWRELGKRFRRLHMLFELKLMRDYKFRQRLSMLVEQMDLARPE